MKTYTFKGEVTWHNRGWWITLGSMTVEAVRMILWFTFWLGIIFAPIILLLNHVIAKKTSDAEFCIRVVDEKARQRLGCPDKYRPITINK